MKKANQELNSIFSVAEEMVKGKGEDCFYFDAVDNKFIIASMDGCGGSGSKKYENFSGKTGAYIASRAVGGGVKVWFRESGDSSKLKDYIDKALNICTQYADKSGRIMGSLSKSFPTTAAIITGKVNAESVDAECFWAGDSRCYMLDANGLHQLTEDDLDGQDAMSNLTNDGVMTNVINASTPFEIHTKRFSFEKPCVFLTATDGCFGYLKSPMEFEHLLINSLVKSKSMLEWKMMLNHEMFEVAGDDYTLCVAVCGFKNFAEMQAHFVKRSAFVNESYISSKADVNEMWEVYKKDYSKYL